MKAILKNFLLPLISLVIIAAVFSTALLTCNASEFNGLDDTETSSEKYMNRLYFVMTTISTVGYGDISPRSIKAKIITMSLQAVVTLGLVTTALSLFKC